MEPAHDVGMEPAHDVGMEHVRFNLACFVNAAESNLKCEKYVLIRITIKAVDVQENTIANLRN